MLEHSETSDNRPFITSDTTPETTPEEQTSNAEPSYTRQQSEQSEQEALANLFQNSDPPQEQPLYPPLSQSSDIQQINASETTTIHDTSEFSEETVQNTRSFTITDDSNPIQIPTHNITQNEFNNQNQDNTFTTNPDNTSVLSTSNTNITQPSQTQVPSPRNYNPPPVPPQFSTQINTHNSPQQSSSNTHHITQNTNTVHFQTPTPPSPSEIQTSTYTLAQTNPVQTTQPTLNINTIHSNPSFNYTSWCNENASTINLKCNEIFSKRLPKKLKDFANKRQVKHTSTVLEPSIPFHTLVKLVDTEDILNDKIRTHDLALEINSITKQLNPQTLDPSSQEQLMFTQPKDPNNKNKTAYKKYCSYCHRTNHSISACFKKQRDDEDKREAYARSKSPQKSFVQYFRSPSNDRTKH